MSSLENLRFLPFKWLLWKKQLYNLYEEPVVWEHIFNVGEGGKNQDQLSSWAFSYFQYPRAIVVAWLVLKCRLVVSPLLIPPPLHPSRRLKVRLRSLP